MIGPLFHRAATTRRAPRDRGAQLFILADRVRRRSSVLGKSIFLDDAAYTVIGVMPPDFHFPHRETQFWTPFRFKEENYQDRDDNFMYGDRPAQARSVRLEQARTELKLIAAPAATTISKRERGSRRSVVSLRDELTTQSRLLLHGLCGAALCVLVIACANLANLLLAVRWPGRRELSIRISLGANRRSILRQLLSESFILGHGWRRRCNRRRGRRVAVAFALGTQLRLPTQQVPPMDVRMLSFALGLTAITVIAFGVAPAFGLAEMPDSVGFARASAPEELASHRCTICAGDCRSAVSVVLLVSSGFLIRAMWRVQSDRPWIPDRAASCRCAPSCRFPKYEKSSRGNSSTPRC